MTYSREPVRYNNIQTQHQLPCSQSELESLQVMLLIVIWNLSPALQYWFHIHVLCLKNYIQNMHLKILGHGLWLESSSSYNAIILIAISFAYHLHNLYSLVVAIILAAAPRFSSFGSGPRVPSAYNYKSNKNNENRFKKYSKCSQSCNTKVKVSWTVQLDIQFYFLLLFDHTKCTSFIYSVSI